MPAVPIQEACHAAFQFRQRLCQASCPPQCPRFLCTATLTPSCPPTDCTPSPAPESQHTSLSPWGQQPNLHRRGGPPALGRDLHPSLSSLGLSPSTLRYPAELSTIARSLCQHLTLPSLNHCVLSLSRPDHTDNTDRKFYFYITTTILMPFSH